VAGGAYLSSFNQPPATNLLQWGEIWVKEAGLAKFYYGGQAVIEGVMMRGQKHMAVAVRAPDGRIVVHEEPLKAAIYRNPIMRLPFLRGFTALWDALGLGMKSLMFSANVAMEEETAQSTDDGRQTTETTVEHEMQGAAATTALPAAPIALPNRQPAPNGQQPAIWVSVVIALVFMIGIFFVLPVLGANLFTWLAGTESSLAHNLIEGGIRLALFIGYIWAISFMPDIKRVFGYHGAEHKTINAWEAGVELTPENVQRFTLLNPRCGTTFLLIVLLMATLLFVFLGKPPFLLMVLSRIVLVPLVAALAYEFIRLMANHYGNPIVRAVMAPGIALQRMTTRPPDASMVEVGIEALKRVLVADGVMSARNEERPAAEQSVSALA
jgi:uncharacterized protein YqhQ